MTGTEFLEVALQAFVVGLVVGVPLGAAVRFLHGVLR